MSTYFLEFTLQSDAIFARGDGVAGLVDVEVQHDVYGFPYLAGRSLKGLLVQECADILDSLAQVGVDTQRWEKAAARLFGESGNRESLLAIGDATFPEDLRQAVAHEIESKKISPEQVLDSLTTVRRQTAMERSGVPKTHTLRSARAIVRETPFRAELQFVGETNDDDLALLAVCVRALRRAGSNRNRGFGRLEDVRLIGAHQQDITRIWSERFFEEVKA